MILQWLVLLYFYVFSITPPEVGKGAEMQEEFNKDVKILVDFDKEKEGMIPWEMKLALLVASACLSTISVLKGFLNFCKACCCKRRGRSQVPTNDIEITDRY